MKNEYAEKNNIILLRDSHIKDLISKIEDAIVNWTLK